MKQEVFWFASLCLLVFLGGCRGEPTHQVEPNTPEPVAGQGKCEADEYAVYDTVLGSWEFWRVAWAKLVVIRDETTVPEELGSAKGVVRVVEWAQKQLPEDIVQDFVEKNKTEHALEPRFRIRGKCILISEKELAEIFNAGWWPAFYARYPESHGVVELSRVGFNSRVSEGLVYFGNQWEGDSGAGQLVLLEKVSGRWRVKWKVLAWIS